MRRISFRAVAAISVAVALGCGLWLASTAGAAGPQPSAPQFASGNNGDPGSSGSAMQVTVGSAHVAQLTSNHYGYGLVSVGFPAGSTFSQLTNLSTQFTMTQGVCSGGAPRYQIDLSGGDYLYLDFGTPPYGGCPSGGPQTEANVIGGTIPQWQVDGSNTFYTYSQVESMIGTSQLLDVQIAVDGGWAQTGDTQQVQVENWNVDGTIFFPYPGGNANCTGALPAGTYDNVVVPAGATCTIGSGVTVQQDVNVGKGATLLDQGATVGHDIHADHPGGIGIGYGGSVGHDIHIDGLSGAGPGSYGGDNYVCNTTIGHDLAVQNTAIGAGTWYIGDPPECTYGNTVGHDLHVEHNANPLDVSHNTVTHDLQVQDNKPGPVVVSNNSAGHDAQCKNNQSQSGTGNTAGGMNSCPS
jgi:hypothetical protein